MFQVEVSEHKIQQALQPYVKYVIEGMDKNGNFELHTRFSELYDQRELLIQQWPGQYVPPLPEKLYLGNLENEKIEERIYFLNYFLKDLIQRPILWYSEEFQFFLRKEIPPEDKKSITEKYLLQFSDLVEDFDESINIKINQFQLYIQIAKPILLEFENQIKKFMHFQQIFMITSQEQKEQMNIFIEFYIRDYEQFFLHSYTSSKQMLPVTNSLDKNIIQEYVEIRPLMSMKHLNYQSKQGINIKSSQLEQSVYRATQIQTGQIKYQTSLDEAMINAFQKIKQVYHVVTKQEQILKEQMMMSQIISKLIAKEIESFKKLRSQSYLALLNQFAQMKINFSKFQIKFFQDIAKHQTLQ
ncbi:hypothetical protein pb186bvf_007550 [Paramecium bursaria]